MELPQRRLPTQYLEIVCLHALTRVKGMGFEWTLNPYIGCVHRCTFCYVRGFELRADRASGEGYGRTVRVKTNVATVLRRDLERPTWNVDGVVMGSATDPYQPIEGKYRLTRSCLQELARARTATSIITRGPLIVRDIDVLVELNKRAKVQVSVSIPTVDRTIWRTTEPGTAPPQQRLRAVRKLVDAGIRVGIGMAPLLPGLSDTKSHINDVIRAAREANATYVWPGMLRLSPGVREHFLVSLQQHWPALLPRYLALYNGRNSAPQALFVQAQQEVQRARLREGIADRRTVRWTPAPLPEQLPLFG